MDIAELAVATVGLLVAVVSAHYARLAVVRRTPRKPPLPPSKPTPSGGAVPVSTDHDVFVSYSHADKELVTDLAGRLEARGLRVAYDEVVVRPGSIILHEIEQTIRDSAHGLLVMSPDSMASGPVMNEYYVLLQKSMYDGRLLIPVLVSDIDNDEIPEFVRIRFYSDLRDMTDKVFDERVDEIAEAVRRAS
ncbi:toll/interleukin-1 receptor domain-containing protein [Planomonospora sp. ID91781]|uniref:toll/interleukin-1 receptor domain-containing protein n=1 Tax=Planomonospora sp. ID91781 TaxID=2738135 RepID=UPI0018C36C82|nr:toll/interleukin-1 receptor domain-containing protein [Planomonospora sp. ID91781]MBG0821824.1 toll/interleukin-1 receptor domain-containing protein [Planomonospora sp. ID91781]